MSPQKKPTDRPRRLTVARPRRATWPRFVAQLSLLARRFRRGFNRENIVSQLQTLAWVVPLTVLIWVYAEQQQVVSESDVPVHIAIHSMDAVNSVASLAAASAGTITVNVRGTETGIQRFKELAQATQNHPLGIGIGGLAPSKNVQSINTMSLIGGDRIFGATGVELTSCSPDTLSVRIDQMREQDVNIEAPADFPGLEHATFSPARVKMRGPSQLLDALEQKQRLVAIADFADEPSLKQPGQHDNLHVHLMPPPLDQDSDLSNAISILPDTVVANVTMRQADVEYQLSGVLVRVREDAAPGVVDQYHAQFNPTLDAPLTMVGPPSEIAKFDGPEKPLVVAYFELPIEEAAKLAHESLPIAYYRGLPPGVSVKPQNPPITVQVDVSRR